MNKNNDSGVSSDPVKPAAGASSGLSFGRLVPVLVLIAGLVAFFAFDLDRFISLTALKENRAALTDWVNGAVR